MSWLGRDQGDPTTSIAHSSSESPRRKQRGILILIFFFRRKRRGILILIFYFSPQAAGNCTLSD
jgi:hypothetical protein